MSYNYFDGAAVFPGKFVVEIHRAKATIGGVILPEQTRERPVSGRVVAKAGDIDDAALKLGDWVSFSKHMGCDVVFPWQTMADGGKEYVILRFEECFMSWTHEAYAKHLEHDEQERTEAKECLAKERDAVKVAIGA